MPTSVLDLPATLEPRRKRWSRQEYETLSAEGLDCQRLELIEGELIDRMGKNKPHVISVSRLLRWLMAVFGEGLVYQEAPIDVAPEDNPASEPEPDLSVLNRDLESIPTRNPRPSDLHLVVEVADSTLGFDLTTKAALYARAGITDYWVLDIVGRRMIVHRDPQAGRYASVAAYAAEERVAPLAAPEAYLRVGDALPS